MRGNIHSKRDECAPTALAIMPLVKKVTWNSTDRYVMRRNFSVLIIITNYL